MAHVKKYFDRVTGEEVEEWCGFHYFCLVIPYHHIDKFAEDVPYFTWGTYRAYIKVENTLSIMASDDYARLFNYVEYVIDGRHLTVLKSDFSNNEGSAPMGQNDQSMGPVLNEHTHAKAMTPLEIIELLDLDI